MQQKERRLSAANIENITSEFCESLEHLGDSITGKTGVKLLTALKRDKLKDGPYPGVTLFEAANRIMSDLVILRGVAGLLRDNVFPFTEYVVEFGNEDKNGFDICARSAVDNLVGEAFNVAPSFFQGKKATAVRKLLEKGASANIRLIMFNEEAAGSDYSPKREDGIYHVFVNIDTGAIRVEPKPVLKN